MSTPLLHIRIQQVISFIIQINYSIKHSMCFIIFEHTKKLPLKKVIACFSYDYSAKPSGNHKPISRSAEAKESEPWITL